jgi:hypothetical protein
VRQPPHVESSVVAHRSSKSHRDGRVNPPGKCVPQPPAGNR